MHASDIERGLLRALTIGGLDPAAGTANPSSFENLAEPPARTQLFSSVKIYPRLQADRPVTRVVGRC